MDPEIERLKQIIQDWEDTDPVFMDDSSRDLRHRIMYVHLRIELTLEILIQRDLMDWWNKKQNLPETAQFALKMMPIFEKMEFYNKLEVCQKKGYITGELVGQILKVNDHRKYFSHPASYQEKIQNYKDKEKYKETLLDLVKAFQGLSNVLEKLSLQYSGRRS